jgi:hypothetical protein
MSLPLAESPESWEAVQRTYEGFPLYLRRPKGLNFEALSVKFPVHMTVTHEFSFRRFDGAPEPTYNDGLEEFDLAVTKYFSQTHEGQAVLVETFGGKRHYYFYVAASVRSDSVLSDLRARFPGLKLEVARRDDPSWNFIRNYTAEYLDDA